MLRIIIGLAIGGTLGGIVGFLGKCSGGTCPIIFSPVGGILFGALVGAALAASLAQPPKT